MKVNLWVMADHPFRTTKRAHARTNINLFLRVNANELGESMNEKGFEIYVIPEATSLYASGTERTLANQFIINEFVKPNKLPKLSEVLKNIQNEINELGIKEWEAAIEAWIEISTGSIIPSGKAGIKTTITISSKSG